MLVIRFTRRGRKNDPSFRLVVAEQSNPVKGKFLEELGFYNPKLKSKTFDKERILHWISKGAKCSPTVNNLLISSEVIQGQKVHAWRPKKKKEGESAKEEIKTKTAAEAAPETVPESQEAPAEPAPEEKKEEEKKEMTGSKPEKEQEAEEKKES